MIREIKSDFKLSLEHTDKIKSAIKENGIADEVNFMIDIETTGKECDGFAPIVSISIVPFTKFETLDELSIYVKMDLSQYDDPRQMRGIKPQSSMSTIDWWMNQSKDAQKEFLGGTSNLARSLSIIKEYVDFFKDTIGSSSNIKMYCKSPDFDLVILHRWARALHLMEEFNFVRYYNARCIRTIKDEALKRAEDKERFISSYPSGRGLTKHNAHVDTLLQIDEVQYCWKYTNE